MKHKNQTNAHAEAAPLSRRSFLGCAGTSTAVAAASVGLPAMLLADNVKAEGDDDGSRRSRSFQIRLGAAIAEREIHSPRQINNGDEDLYPNFIGNYSQGLPHDSLLGEVDVTAYRALLTAVDSGAPDDFAKVPLVGTPSCRVRKAAWRSIWRAPIAGN